MRPNIVTEVRVPVPSFDFRVNFREAPSDLIETSPKSLRSSSCHELTPRGSAEKRSEGFVGNCGSIDRNRAGLVRGFPPGDRLLELS